MTIDLSSFETLRHQAAGHPGVLNSLDGSLFAKPTSQQEIDFYNYLTYHSSDDNDNGNEQDDDSRDIGSKFVDWIPRYIGVLETGISAQLNNSGQVTDEIRQAASITQRAHSGNSPRYILLENLLHGYSEPSILDIKLGSVLYDETADEAKVERMQKVSRETTSGSLHFRICGMKIVPVDGYLSSLRQTSGFVPRESSMSIEGEYVSFDKQFGRSLTDDTVTDGLRIFFENNRLPEEIQAELKSLFHVRLQMIYNCLLDIKMTLISGSLFFVFENGLSRWQDEGIEHEVIYQHLVDDDEDEESDEEEEGVRKKLSSLNVIDFAHAKRSDSTDENIIVGVENLIRTMEEMI